jgi:hypothetical protein
MDLGRKDPVSESQLITTIQDLAIGIDNNIQIDTVIWIKAKPMNAEVS